MSRHLNYMVQMHDEVKLNTSVFIPDSNKTYPIIFIRNPYDSPESDLGLLLQNYSEFLENGYVVVYQQCRGTAKSEGDCIPFINERQDGLDTLEWIRKQPFYNKEIYLLGASYLSAVHLSYLDPTPKDVKGAILEVFDSNRYTACFHNGFIKQCLTNWYVNMYKKNGATGKNKNYSFPNSLKIHPFTEFSKTVFNENIPSFDKPLNHPNPQDDFWKTELGGKDTLHVMKNTNIPILLVTSFYDLFTEGIFKMWKSIPENNINNCALIVTPYNHSKSYDENICPIKFEGGEINDLCPSYFISWFNSIRDKQPLIGIKKGQTNYYNLFENKWKTEKYLTNGKNELTLYLSKDRTLNSTPSEETKISYKYDPENPASFKGGICNDFDGMGIEDEPNSREDIISFISKPFNTNKFIKGKMEVKLTVSSTCEDTSFYIRVSIIKNGISYSLRDDITSISNQKKEYKINSKAILHFQLIPHSFMISKGDKIRIDVSSSDFPHFSIHTNYKGNQNIINKTQVALNTIITGKSEVKLFTDN